MPPPPLLHLPAVLVAPVGYAGKFTPQETGGGGGFEQNQIRGGGGVGNVHYNEDMPLAIHKGVHGDGRGTWAIFTVV